MSISTLSIDKNHDVNASKTTEDLDLHHLQKKIHNHSDSAPKILTSLTGVLLVTSYN